MRTRTTHTRAHMQYAEPTHTLMSVHDVFTFALHRVGLVYLHAAHMHDMSHVYMTMCIYHNEGFFPFIYTNQSKGFFFLNVHQSTKTMRFFVCLHQPIKGFFLNVHQPTKTMKNFFFAFICTNQSKGFFLNAHQSTKTIENFFSLICTNQSKGFLTYANQRRQRRFFFFCLHQPIKGFLHQPTNFFVYVHQPIKAFLP